MRRLWITSLPFVALLVIAAGCGGDDADESAATTTAAVETAEQLPDLSPGWTDYRNAGGGFALGLPPGWTAKELGTRSLIQSPDQLVAVTISADRTSEALALAAAASAVRSLEAVPGLDAVRTGDPHPFRHHYEAIEVEGAATGNGIRQRLRLVVLRRDDLAVITALVAENAEQNAGAQATVALRMLRTLRTQPVG